jgi:hypothetical protein
MGLVAEIERQLAEARWEGAGETSPDLRTSVMTHVVWAPPDWVPAALETLAGLEERHPSRTIVLVPEGGRKDEIVVEAHVRCFVLEGVEREICSEVVVLRLRGGRDRAPDSIVLPLLVPDLPVFCRWRGEPPWGKPQLERLVRVVDRLVVDSAEWRRVPAAYERLAELFGRTAVSDIAFSRTLPWRARIAGLWPGAKDVTRIEVTGPKADAALLAGWLRSRLKRPEIALRRRDAERVERVLLDGEPVEPPPGEPLSASDLLSIELDVYSRDPVYEAAALTARSPR